MNITLQDIQVYIMSCDKVEGKEIERERQTERGREHSHVSDEVSYILLKLSFRR